MTADPKPAPAKKRRRYRKDTRELSAAIEWHRLVTALGCQVCPELGNDCEGIVQGHHILRKQVVLRYIDAVAHEQDLSQEAKLLLTIELVWATENGLGVCYRAHRRHHNRTQPIPLHLVPLPAIAFAARLGKASVLEDEYPESLS